MYDVGFGDAFLLFFPSDDGRRRKVLIDCGSIKNGSMSMRAVVRSLVSAAAEGEPDKEPHLDVVVATHRHQDHVSGFTQNEWAGVHVGEVWLPWTEDPKNPEATRIRDVQHRQAVQLTTAPWGSRNRDVAGLIRNALTNEAAMRTLHVGFAGGREVPRLFLPAQSEDRQIATAALPGVTVHVMGPSRNSEMIRDMDPPAGASYLRLQSAIEREQGTPEPFRSDWWLSSSQYGRRFREVARLAPRRDRKTIAEPRSAFERAVAVALDSAVNGTSLMLAFEFRNIVLLFPGDAQWGTWERALGDPEWKSLLKRTSFYKVGHHGSHNATPRAFVEFFDSFKNSGRDAFWSMASVRPISQWQSIPRAALLRELRVRTRKLIRSDAPAQGRPLGFRRCKGYIQALIPFE